MPHEKIADWNDVNQALARLGGLHRDLAALEVARDQAIDEAKRAFGEDGEPIVEALTALGAQVKRFVDAHREELGGARSKKLEHGTVAYRWTTKLAIAGRRVKTAIAWLLENKKAKYLHVEHKLHREALRDAPAEILKAIGARVTHIEQFRYEVDDASYVVEDAR